jgi:pimeloyl-ACP methyl ester carboxylesterase
MMRKLKRWCWLLLLIPVLAAGGFVAWAESTPAPMPEARAALEAAARTDDVLVLTNDRLTFRPTDQTPTTGLILYPGGRVDPRAYAPTARAIADRGYLVVITPMPLNLAFFAPNRAQAVIDDFPAIKHWAVGGHSLGGAMAARFAHRHPSAVEGLALWASYPAASESLAERDLAVVSIYGTRDGLATPEEIKDSRPRLPAATRWVAVEGGNHAQFGWYGPQGGDHPALIGRSAQQHQVINATVRMLRHLGE